MYVENRDILVFYRYLSGQQLHSLISTIVWATILEVECMTIAIGDIKRFPQQKKIVKEITSWPPIKLKTKVHSVKANTIKLPVSGSMVTVATVVDAG